MAGGTFDFLEDRWPPLAKVADTAEKNVYQDPNTAISKFRLFAETITKYILAFEEVDEPNGMSQIDRLRLLYQEQILPRSIHDLFQMIRMTGNKATHEALYGTIEEAKTIHRTAYQLATWYMEVYGDWNFEVPPYQEPKEIQLISSDEVDELTKQYQEKLEVMEQELVDIRKQQMMVETESKRRRKQNAYRLAAQLEPTEEQTRKLIDQQLSLADWEVDTVTIRYAKGARPEHGKNKAIAEWPLKGRYADYALFIGMRLIGIIEAKKESKDVYSAVSQAKDYAKLVIRKGEEEIFEPWGDCYVPFIFATNGRPYQKQLEQKSGIWFLDTRLSTNHPKALQGWYTPEGLKNIIEQDREKADQKLEEEKFDYLNLRDYQVEAIQAIEQAIRKEQREVLIGMATGTGKTRMAIGLIYRLIKSGRFNRVLFLVDRKALGEQAEAAFKDSKIEKEETFYHIYNLQTLEDKAPEKETKVQIATVQGMLKRLLSTDDKSKLTIDQYDCIIIDEAHRGYTLDREMSEFELKFRDHQDYVSKYRQVLEFFDAVKIGLTATPALHTREIFGDPVYNYSYREAVVEGYLIDHEPPVQFETALKQQGIKWAKGDTVNVYDTKERTVRQELLEDEVNIEVTQFNTRVVTENFNKVIINELVNYISPDDEGKTLIFAATNDHADLVVRLLKEAFDQLYGKVEDHSIMKITGTIDNPSTAIKRFKNERFPSIVVTVDLLTTGIDVPAISNLVFLRRVRSRILYEQMLGRATRRCEEISKEHFMIFDAVGIYEALKPYSAMKPVVARPNVSLVQLAEEIQAMDQKDEVNEQIDQILARMNRKKQAMSEKGAKDFSYLSNGKDIDTLMQELKDTRWDQVKEILKGASLSLQFLDENRHRSHKQFISDHEDELLRTTRGYGNAEKPDDYLQSFEHYIRDNMNELPALTLVCQRPAYLTRGDLKKLRLTLEQEGFTEKNLQTAWRESKNQDIAADIIAFIRQLTLGDPLIDHEERIKQAMQKIYNQKQWPPLQKKWLQRIEKQLLKESVLHPQPEVIFNEDPYSEHGGYEQINKIFKGELPGIVREINTNLYQYNESS